MSASSSIRDPCASSRRRCVSRGGGGRLPCPAGLYPGRIPPLPPPGVFSEVLILKGFETNVSEVLIIQGLLSRLVILIDLKSLIISDLIKNEDFAKVLILEELQRDFSEVLNLEDLNGAKRANGWI
jgi:hypothetical protein